jgi:hypothetical protein
VQGADERREDEPEEFHIGVSTDSGKSRWADTSAPGLRTAEIPVDGQASSSLTRRFSGRQTSLRVLSWLWRGGVVGLALQFDASRRGARPRLSAVGGRPGALVAKACGQELADEELIVDDEQFHGLLHGCLTGHSSPAVLRLQEELSQEFLKAV